ncbi:DUF1015 domain-containing protein [Dehalococcoidia bacterium]|nr:DUF1015 domain-containing protein [Dehalococcoidia bacterium]
MADVRPFRGLRFDPAKVGPLGAVVAPPYDVISPQDRRALTRISKYNIAHIELPESPPGTNPYTDAGQILQGWRRDGALVQDFAPSFYLTHHTFTYSGVEHMRTELTVALRLEEPGSGSVKPHEDTRSKAKEDRRRLLESTATDISPIMLLADIGTMENLTPDGDGVSAHIGEAERFTMWPITSPETIATIRKLLEDHPVYIADGHHRYETALGYSKTYSHNPATSFVMATLISFSDPSLLMLPYHRLLGPVNTESVDAVITRLREICSEERHYPADSSPVALGKQALDLLQDDSVQFAAWGIHPGNLSVFRLRNHRTVELISEDGHSIEWSKLSTSMFREAILRPALGITEEEGEANGLLSFCKDAIEAVEAVNNGTHRVAIFPKQVPFQVLRSVSDRGERLPPKSTFFYPKLATGLVLMSLDGDL